LERIDVAAAAVYLLTEDRGELRAVVIGGAPPSIFSVPGRMNLDAPYASSRALRSGHVEVLEDPDPVTIGSEYATAYPYIVASAPVEVERERVGALTVLRREDLGAYPGDELQLLKGLADRLGDALAPAAKAEEPLTTGHLPLVVPMFGRSTADRGTRTWGIPGAAGSAGSSMMYPLRRLADMLNQATDADQVMAAVRFCVMEAFKAQALALAFVDQGRLWVFGHSGNSSGVVRELHGRTLQAPVPAAQAVRDRRLLVVPAQTDASGDDLIDAEWSAEELGAVDAEHGTEVYLPLVGNPHVDLPFAPTQEIVGVCCLTFAEARDFVPDERALLTMMAGLMGAAVRRIELGSRRQALAERLQKSLLPRVLEEVPRLRTTARYLPATATPEVGGDWYDVIGLPEERVVLVVGDVEGHTIDSAAVMGQVRSALVAYATEGHRPAAIIDRTGRLLAELGTELLVTCCIVALDPVDGFAEVALAGHPAPLVRRADGHFAPLEAPANLPLGVAGAGAYESCEHRLETGDVLVLYSDGLAPADSAGATEQFGSECEACRHGLSTDLEDLADRLVARCPSPAERRDDAVLLLAQREGTRGGDAPRAARMVIDRNDLGGVRAARIFVDNLLFSWGLQVASDDLQLIVSELVTNALIHAGSDVELRLRAFSGHVRVEVRDSASSPPVPSPFSVSDEGMAQAEHGRGLMLVGALARRWNTAPNGRGKTVWLEMAVPAA
jgi:GAF domain-containing protein